MHAVSGLSWNHAVMMASVEPAHPIYGLQARALSDDGPLPESVGEMAADYVRQIRRVQPHGPYHLLGWSFGGLVAHAMATALQRDGESVALLAVLDAYPAVTVGHPVLPEVNNRYPPGVVGGSGAGVPSGAGLE